MATSLAPNVIDSCAAARAGITRMSELSVVSLSECAALGQEPIVGCLARYLAQGFIGIAKTLLLGKAALADLRSRISLSNGSLRRTGIFINLSDQFYPDSTAGSSAKVDRRLPSAVWAEQCEQLIPRLLQASNLETIPQNHRLYFGGHTGFVQAVEEAASLLSAGHFDRCLVGGIDSCVEPRFLNAAATKGVLKTSANPVGFVPGEAAAFIMLERTADARSRKDRPVGFLMGTSLLSNCRDRLSDDAPDGVGLARAIDQALRTSHQPLASIVSDLNGDDYRAREWGNALPRLRPKHNVAEAPGLIPALAFGETGAAAAPVGLCLGMIAQQRGWIPQGLIVEWLSADKGSRAALCFAFADGAQ
jgi:3-oxoacyl-[acyl-carrier-protein] synthase I